MTTWPRRTVTGYTPVEIIPGVHLDYTELECGHLVNIAHASRPAIGEERECRRCWAVGRDAAVLGVAVDPVSGGGG